MATGGHTPNRQRRPVPVAAGQSHDRGVIIPIKEEHRRVAYCECGARLQGQTKQELFDATEAHLAHHHPELLGAVGLDVVQQMAEERPGASNA